MYKKRQKLAKDHSLSRSDSVRSSSPDSSELDPVQPDDRQRSVELNQVYRPQPIQKRKKAPLGMTYKPIEIGYKEKVVSTRLQQEGLTQAIYDHDTQKTLPKKINWETISPLVRKQMRQILSDNYKKTLMHIAGTSSEGPSDSLHHLGENVIKPIAAQIDKTLLGTLLPNKLDDNLLDPDLPETTSKMRKRLETDIRMAAEYTVMIDEKKNELAKKKEILQDLLEKNRIAKEEQEKYSHRILHEHPEDYVQMLIRNPASRDY